MSNSRRLAILIHDLNPYGGQDRSMLEIARRLSKQVGVDVYSFSLEDPKRNDWGDLRFFRVCGWFRKPVLLKSLWYYGVSVTLPLRYWARGEKVPLRLATGACAFGSDWVQTQFVHAGWHEYREKLPAVATGIRGIYQDFMHFFNCCFERLIFTRQRHYIAIARVVASELKRHFAIPEERLQVVHHGVDPEFFCLPNREAELKARALLRSELHTQPDEMLLLFVGAYDRKGLAFLIDALALLPRELLRKMKLVAVGSGNQDFYRRRAEALGVQERVRFVGHQKDIRRYYQASDAFVLPTLYEPFGMVVTEAMACGLVPAVSVRAGASELIRDGESGFLIQDPESPESIAAAMEKLLTGAGEMAHRSEAARKAAAAWTWDRVAEAYWKILKPEVSS